MKKFFATMLAMLGLGSSAIAAEQAKPGAEMTKELRMMALNLKPSEIGLTPESFPHEVWGVLMETGMEDGAYSLVVLADGTTSLYFSNGGGIIGAGTKEPVRSASGQFLGWANKYVSEAKSASSYPLPTEGNTTFYFLTFHGVRSYTAVEQDLGEQRDKLSNLFHAGHAVITEVRKSQEQGPNNSLQGRRP